MDEKRLPGSLAAKPESRRRPTYYWLVYVICGLSYLFIKNAWPSETRPQARQYPGEHIAWQPCGDVAGVPVECSEITVPMDHDHLDAHHDAITFSIPLIRMRGQTATQNLLLNPGGPGGSGISFMHRLGKQLRDIVGEGFHLVSFDPRGINGSTPRASCYPDTATRQKLSAVRSLRGEVDSPEVFAWAQNFVKACPDTMGEYAGYVNTPQTAADMNHIIDALGQENMVYWGFSYGSLLGQTYATMFPERAARIVIDGVVNQAEWYGLGFDEASSLVDTDAVLDGFFDRCIQEGPESCSLAPLADSMEALRDLVLAKMDELADQPISVYVNNTNYGLLTFEAVWFNGVFPALYKPQKWAGLADNLHELLQGNATAAFLAYSDNGAGEAVDEAQYVVELNDGFTGPEHWPQERELMLEQILSFHNVSMFDTSQDKVYYQRQQWTLPKRHSYVPRKGVKTAHPMLIASTTYDPVCPLVAARSANEAFEDSQIVEVKGYGHCSVAMPSVCFAKHLRRFLYEGNLPEEYTQCEVDSPYFVKPSESAVTTKSFESADEQKLHLAQLKLAREWHYF